MWQSTVHKRCFIEIGLILKLFFIRCKASWQKINKLMFVIDLVFCLLVLPQVLYWRGLSCLGLTFGVFPGLLGQCISVTYRRRTARKKLALTTRPETHRPRAIMTPQRGSGVGTLPSFGLNGHVPPNRVWFGGVLNNTGGWAFAVQGPVSRTSQ